VVPKARAGNQREGKGGKEIEEGCGAAAVEGAEAVAVLFLDGVAEGYGGEFGLVGLGFGGGG